MKFGGKDSRIFVIVFFLALILRVCLFAINLNHNGGNVATTIHGDDGYYEFSQNLIHGRGLSSDVSEPYRPAPLRPPVWPMIIAFFAGTFGTYWAIAIFELLIGSLIPLMGMHIARRLNFSRAIWIGVGILLTIEPYDVLLSSLLYSETMFTFLFLISVIFIIRFFENDSVRNTVWMSVFLGLATLVKPTVEYIPAVLAIIIVWYEWYKRRNVRKKTWGRAALILAVFGMVMAPWVYRNWVEFGKIGISAQPEFNLFVYLEPTILSFANHTDFRTEYDKLIIRNNIDVNSINMGNSDYYKRQALGVILKHPGAIAESAAISFVTFFVHDGMLTVLQNSGIVIEGSSKSPALMLLLSHPLEFIRYVRDHLAGPGFVVMLARLIWIAIAILMIFGIVLMFRNRIMTPTIWVILFLLFYFSLTTCINGLGVNARFRVPVNTFIFMFGLYGLLGDRGIMWYIRRIPRRS